MAKRAVDFSNLPPDTRWTDPQLAEQLARQERARAGKDYAQHSSNLGMNLLKLAGVPMSGLTNIVTGMAGIPGRLAESGGPIAVGRKFHEAAQNKAEGFDWSEKDANAAVGTAGDVLGLQMMGGAMPFALEGAGGSGLAAGVGRIPRRGLPGSRVMPDIPPPAKSNVPVDASVGDKANPGFAWKGKEPHEMTAQDWHDAGVAYGTKRPLGPADEAAWRANLQSYTLPSGRTITIPGGEEPFTYYDTLHMKSQGVPTEELRGIDPEMRQKIHDRMVAAAKPTESPAEMAPHSMFNKLLMGMESPNNPLTPNQIAHVRTMAKGPEDLKAWAESIPWKHSTGGISQADRLRYSDEIADRMGINKGEQGGLGARGTTDYTRIAEMAQMMQEKPDFFRFKGAEEGGATEAEQWANFVQRTMSQVPGLSAKTGSFGAVWQDPERAATSAIDRHMVRKADREGALFKTDDDRIEAERLAANRHFIAGGEPVERFEQLPEKVKDDAYFGYLNTHPVMNVRTAKGAPNPKLPEGVLGTDWVKEPKQVSTFSEPYKRVQEVNQQAASTRGHGLFSDQWFNWDDIRNRLEPHENMNPDLERLPRMSMEQVQRARQAHKDAGYLAAKGGVRPVENPSSLSLFDLSGVPASATGGQQPIPGALGGGPVPTGFQPPPDQGTPPAAPPVDLSMLDPEKMRLMFGGPR